MAATDLYQGSWDYLMVGPVSNAAAVATSDSNDLQYVTRGLYVGGAGDVKVTMKGGQTETFYSVGAGTVLPIRVSRVWATGTSATNLTALW